MEVSTYDFSTKTYKYLDEGKLPIIITKYGKPVYRVIPYGGISEEDVPTSDENVGTKSEKDKKFEELKEAADTFDGSIPEVEDWGVCEGHNCNNPAIYKIKLIDSDKVLKVCGRCKARAENEDALSEILEEKQ